MGGVRNGKEIAIEFPDDIGQTLGARVGDVSRAVSGAFAKEAYRSRAIRPAEMQQMLRMPSRWEAETFLKRAEAYHDYTMEDLERDIGEIRDLSRQ